MRRRVFVADRRRGVFSVAETTGSGNSLPGQRVTQMTSVGGVMLKYLATEKNPFVCFFRYSLMKRGGDRS